MSFSACPTYWKIIVSLKFRAGRAIFQIIPIIFFPLYRKQYGVTTFQLDSHFNLYIVNVFPSQKLKINFCRNICGSVCDHVCVVASKKRSWKIWKGLVIALRLPSVSIVSYFLCISFVSGLESRGLSKLFIVNTRVYWS